MVFPTPLGGTPFDLDFAPSILFAILHFLFLPLVAYRCFAKKSRTLLLINAGVYFVERVVIYSIRAAMSRIPEKRASRTLLVYMQLSFALGYVNVAQDFVKLLRTVLVKASYPNGVGPPEPSDDSPSSQTEIYLNVVGTETRGNPSTWETSRLQPDEPKQRYWARRLGDLEGIAYLTVIILDTIAGMSFSKAIEHQNIAHLVMRLRYAATALSLILLIITSICACAALLCRPRVNRRALITLIVLCTLMMSPALYRLIVMHNTTASILSTSPGSLNSSAAKATFYIFHIAPEFLATSLLFFINVRQIFNTDLMGDWRGGDETSKQREKRLKRQANKRAKKRVRVGRSRVEQWELTDVPPSFSAAA